jgi:flagellar biosynthesis protein FliR
MNFESWTISELLTFFMVFIRMSTLVAVMPLFGDKVIPVTVKILLSLALSVAMFPMLVGNGWISTGQTTAWMNDLAAFVGTLTQEVLVGLTLGFSAQLVFHTITAAGDFIGQFLGLNTASSYDPHLQAQTALMGQILSALGMLAFLSIDGHLMLVKAIADSFHWIAIGQFSVGEGFKTEIIRMTTNVLSFGLQLSAPVAMVMMFLNIIYGVLAKTLPQLNILTLSMSMSLFVGLMVLFASYPAIHSGMIGLFQGAFEDLTGLMRLMKKGA